MGRYLLCSMESINILGASLFSRIDGFTTTSKNIFDVDTERILNTGFIGTAVMSIIRYFATSLGFICIAV